MTRTVLVVDDSPGHLKLMEDAMREAGYTTLTAEDGEQAITQAVAHHPDVVLLDVVLPKKNGYQVCRQLKTMPETSSIKIVLVSSKTQDSDQYWGMKQGADGYVRKPFASQDLLAAVEEAF